MSLTAVDYHNGTSYDRKKMTGHMLDWTNQPSTFKTYEGLDYIELTGDQADGPTENLSDLLDVNRTPISNTINFRKLSRILKLTHCLTRKERHPGGHFYFRNVASAGALYPFETYFCSDGVRDLNDGLYHHSVAAQSIAMLKRGNCVEDTRSLIHFKDRKVTRLVFLFTAFFFRSSWKYRDRAFRYHLLDTGHLIENLTLALKSEKFRFEISYDFDDARINELLAVDTARESCLAAVGVFLDQEQKKTEKCQNVLPAAELEKFSKCSSNEIQYTAISDIYSGTSNSLNEPKNPSPQNHPSVVESDIGLIQLPSFQKTPESITFAEALFQRRSRRNFVRKPIPSHVFSWLIWILGIDLSSGQPPARKDFLSVGVLISDVEGVAPGFYLLKLGENILSVVRHDRMAEEMAHICLDQDWLRACSLHFVFLSNLEETEHRFGTRSYRHAMLESGRLGQRLYLAAESVGYGCCGIGAFYDEEARSFLRLNSESRLLYLVALGPLKKSFV